MIHTVNANIELTAAQIPLLGGQPVVGHIDLPGALTAQLQRMVRQGNMFKVVGIDMALSLQGDQNQSGIVSGYLRYYAPTRGRCEAYRAAFKSMAEMMKIQGISMRENRLYDFRVPLSEQPGTAFDYVFKNQATLNGTDGLYLGDGTTEGCSVFGVHNDSVRPIYEGSNVYGEGFKTLLDDGASRTDFVLNDVAPYTGNADSADLNYEQIPFQIAISTTTDEHATATFQYRPDPALYLAVMCGQFEVYLTDFDIPDYTTDPLQKLDLNFAVQVSGWKSIMGNPDNKRKGRR